MRLDRGQTSPEETRHSGNQIRQSHSQKVCPALRSVCMTQVETPAAYIARKWLRAASPSEPVLDLQALRPFLLREEFQPIQRYSESRARTCSDASPAGCRSRIAAACIA